MKYNKLKLYVKHNKIKYNKTENFIKNYIKTNM